MRNEWPHSFAYFYPHVFELINQTLSNPDKRLKNGQVKGKIWVTRFRRKYYFYSGSSFNSIAKLQTDDVSNQIKIRAITLYFFSIIDAIFRKAKSN